MPKSKKQLRQELKAQQRTLREDSVRARRWGHVLANAYKSLSAIIQSGKRTELLCRGVGEHKVVLIELQEHPEKGPEILIWTKDRKRQLGYWYAPGHQHNPLGANRSSAPVWFF